MSYIGNEPPDTGAYGVQSFDGGGTSFTLSKPSTTATVLLFIDGVRQTPVDAYSVSGVTLTTTATTPSGTDNVTVQFLGDVVDFGEPSDDSVSTAKIQDDAVTADKLANSINTEIAANTAKVTNATHTGDVTGATALTIAADAVDIAMLSATGTADSTTFLRGDNAWTAVVAGIGTASQWKVESSIDTVDGENVFSGTWAEVGRVGSAMTVSSGVFTFPSTGIWNIVANLSANRSSSSPYWQFRIYTTTNDGGAWTLSYNSSEGFYGSDGYANITNAYTFDVTDVSNYKVRFACELTSDNGVATTNPNSPTAIFSRWGDT